jgi:hypothetical protein
MSDYPAGIAQQLLAFAERLFLTTNLYGVCSLAHGHMFELKGAFNGI